jgi:DNA-binding response OmpR family regulator
VKVSDSLVLIIEDDPLLLWHLQHQLIRFGTKTIKVFDLEEHALREIKWKNVDLTITNLKLESGWVDEKFIRELTYYSKSVIVLTGLSDQKLFPFEKLPAEVKLLFKPYTIHQLKSILN